MACGAGFNEHNPAKDQFRNKAIVEKNHKAALKILEFFAAKSGTRCTAFITTVEASLEAKRIKIIPKKDVLLIQHRGYEILISCSDPASLSSAFRSWIASQMTHITKIEPRIP